MTNTQRKLLACFIFLMIAVPPFGVLFLVKSYTDLAGPQALSPAMGSILVMIMVLKPLIDKFDD